MTAGRLWLALVVVFFCLPLFFALGRADLRGDEAIYSFAVDRMIETGDWLAPRSSPSDDAVFLEKPPLKLWMVALPIRFGVLPHDEFGLRFWDPLLGAIAFVYVFLMGRRIAGPVCGAVAVLILFSHDSLILDHGIRSNNMEAALLLAYTAGIYHFLEWIGAWPDSNRTDAGRDRRRVHAFAVGGYFVLAFMTKFVAAFFLPLILAVVTLAVAEWRRAVLRAWALWLAVGGAALVLIAPWFIYARLRFGRALWDTMVMGHVYTRFTTYLDPAHVHPWNFYFLYMYDQLAHAQEVVPVFAGLIVVAAELVRTRSPVHATVLTWFALPLFLISFGSSKLYHYTYPFLPPLAIAAGYVAAVALQRGPAWVARMFDRAGARDAAGARGGGLLRHPIVRGLLMLVAVAGVALSVGTLVLGDIRVNAFGMTLVRNSMMLRPLLIAAVFALLAWPSRRGATALVAVIIAAFLPLSAYVDVVSRMGRDGHPMRVARDCVMSVGAQEAAEEGTALYVHIPGDQLPHEVNYYFRRIKPWTRTETWQPEAVERALANPESMRPALVWGLEHPAQGPEPDWEPRSRLMGLPSLFFDDIALLLPGPYAACAQTPAVS